MTVMMENLNFEELQQKLDIIDAAIELYVEHEGVFSLHQVAEKTGQTVADIFHFFPNKKAVLHFFYTSLVIRYRLMTEEIEGFENYTLSEKLSNFAYASFDMLEERQAFVEATFSSMILHTCAKTDYEKEIEKLLADFFESDTMAAASSALMLNSYFFSVMRYKYLRLISFWLADESEDKMFTMQLTDKVTGLIQECMYTSVIDRGLDLTKFLYANKLFCSQLPLWEKITSTFEIR